VNAVLPTEMTPGRNPRATLRTAVLMACLMVAVAFASLALRPPAKAPGAAPKYLLEQIVPKEFGEWREVPPVTTQVVNPEGRTLLDKLYSQLLMRTYVNRSGYRVMLALAYGDDQRGELQAHMPDVCYPAQGFKLEDRADFPVTTPFGDVPARRLNTSNKAQARIEPVTYWFTVGGRQVQNKMEQRLIEIKLGFAGEVPDGLLFRVSSIDPQTDRAYKEHDQFVNDLLKAVPPRDRARLSGLQAAVATP
jgi:EpsI family protein